MKTRIIAAFPGTGKSTYNRLYPGTSLDLDSKKYQWLEGTDFTPNPEFPENYIKAIQENIGKYEFIFVSTQRRVREALLKNCLFFYLIYPDESRKGEFLNRYHLRGDSIELIDRINQNWYAWITALSFCDVGCKQVRMILPNLLNELNHIKRSEAGDS